MKRIALQFDFIQNSSLIVWSNDQDQLISIAKYYADYCVADREVIGNRDEIWIEFTSSDQCEVHASFYRENPKKYHTENVFKLCLDIIDDYIALKIEQLQEVNGLFLHGSGVLYKGIPIVLIGKSKSGKSTAVLKLLHALQSIEFISDDFISCKIKEKLATVEAYRMPLHIRIGSLCFNHLYHAEAMDNEQMYIGLSEFESIQKRSFVLPCVFEVKFGGNNVIREIQGTEKVNVLMRNLKYYNSKMINQIADFSSKVSVYQLFYTDDKFLISSILDILHLDEYTSANTYREGLIKYHLEKKNISHITVQGNSMYPTLKNNQNVVFEYLSPDEVKEGDIILFYRQKHLTVHRVVRITQESGNRLFYAKGDNNETVDTDGIQDGDIIGRIIF